MNMLFSRYPLLILIMMIFSLSCKKKPKNVPEELPVFGSCEVVAPVGGMSLSPDGGFIYQTSGGGKIVINHDLSLIISHKDYAGFSLEFWGSVPQGAASYNHENLNGKHVKDRVGNRRTVVFPDGAKITWYVREALGPAVSITIYDGDQVHHINPACNTLEYSTDNPVVAKRLDDLEADGETCTFEITATGLRFKNIYTEEMAGNKVMDAVLIAELFKDNPTRVNDYWN